MRLAHVGIQYRLRHFGLQQLNFLNHFLDLVPQDAEEAEL
jgi:hypothetical protein